MPSTRQAGLVFFCAALIFTYLFPTLTQHYAIADDSEQFAGRNTELNRVAPLVSVDVTRVEVTPNNELSISVNSIGLPMDILRLPIQIVEITDGREQVVTDFTKLPEYVGARRLIVVNYEQFDAIGSNGQRHRINFESMLREIYDHPSVFTNEDWLSAYQIAQSARITQITEWSQKKSQYFIALVTHPFEEISTFEELYTPVLSDVPARTLDLTQPTLENLMDDSGAALQLPSARTIQVETQENQRPAFTNLRGLLERFELLPPTTQAVESVIIFSDSEQSIVSSGRSSIDSLIQYAQRNGISIHGVHMARLDDVSSKGKRPAQPKDLEQLALETGGLYVYYKGQSDLYPLWTRLNEEKQRTRLVYHPDAEQIDQIKVRVTLPDGAYTESGVAPAKFVFDTDNEPMSESIALDRATSELAEQLNRNVNATGLAAMVSTPIVVRLPSFLGLSDSVTLPRELLLSLWAICLCLLVFLTFPEVLRAWRYMRHAKLRVNKPLPDAEAHLVTSYTLPRGEMPLREAGSSPMADITTLSPSYRVDENLSSGNGLRQNGGIHLADSIVTNGHVLNGNNGFVFKDPAKHRIDNPIENDETNVYDAVFKHELGRLIRITYDASLPPEIPIYQTSQLDIDEITIYIGRTKQKNTVIIPDKKKRISREHAMIILEKGLLYLRDNESIAGTYLNGGKLEATERKLLRDKDRIGFGSVEYQIQLQSEEPTIISTKESTDGDA